MSGESGDADRLAYSKTEQFNSKQAVRSSTHKLIHTFDTGTNAFGFPITPGFELYDLRDDPEERHNIFSRDSQVGWDSAGWPPARPWGHPVRWSSARRSGAGCARWATCSSRSRRHLGCGGGLDAIALSGALESHSNT